MNRNRIWIIVTVLLVATGALAVTSHLMSAGKTTTRPVEVVSVEGDLPPYTPAGPNVSVTLKNTGMVPITELTAALAIPRAGPTSEPFTFHFNVSPSNPLMPNQSITENNILIGGGFDSDHAYSLNVNGSLMDGTPLSYTFSVKISQPPITNSISLRDVGLCASICIYPSPYVSATIFVNASVPLSTLHLFINGTDEGITTTANTMTHYALLFKAGPNNAAMPIVDGKTYAIMVVATFQDNSTCTVSATVVAGSGSGITTTNT